MEVASSRRERVEKQMKATNREGYDGSESLDLSISNGFSGLCGGPNRNLAA